MLFSLFLLNVKKIRHPGKKKTKIVLPNTSDLLSCYMLAFVIRVPSLINIMSFLMADRNSRTHFVHFRKIYNKNLEDKPSMVIMLSLLLLLPTFSRDVFRTRTNIYNGFFLIPKIGNVNYFKKEAPSSIFNKVSHIHLL